MFMLMKVHAAGLVMLFNWSNGGEYSAYMVATVSAQ
jgi:p-aminobenzoyl-glutamate transporter AbgT